MSEDQYKPLYISKFDVKLSEQSRKEVKTIELHIGNKTLRVFHTTVAAGGSHNATFIPALTLQPGESLRLSVQCNTRYRRNRELNINIDHKEISSKAVSKGAMRTYETSAHKIDGIVSLHLLRPTTDSILEISPWFRVLIIGNSGAGKTSLIQKVFGVNEIHATDDQRGINDINKEFVSSQNGRFVFHDSDGFEEGDTGNVETVKKFVRERKGKQEVKEQLHAVWLCLETPYSEGRLLQTGVERFLEHRDEILVGVPLVIVLTKVDLLDDQLTIKMMEDKSEGETFERRRRDFLEKYCAVPLRRAAPGVPYVVVSSSPKYSCTHAEVINATKDLVGENIGKDPSMVIEMAQRTSVQVNFDSSIAIGKKKYWSRLGKSAFLSGYTVMECVKVLHEDIVAVWNFNDPQELLHKKEFMDALFRVGDFDLPESSARVDIPGALGAARTMVSSNLVLATVLAVVDATLLGARLAYETQQQFARVIKALMLYIIGSMFVMQIIFLLSPENEVTPEVLDYAIWTYLHSKKKQDVRRHIDAFDVKRGMAAGGPDLILEQVERLIRSFILSDDDIKKSRQEMKKHLLECKEQPAK